MHIVDARFPSLATTLKNLASIYKQTLTILVSLFTFEAQRRSVNPHSRFASICLRRNI